MSPPTRGRGLKRHAQAGECATHQVAPHAGAWIETLFGGTKNQSGIASPPTRGRGLKLERGECVDIVASRPPRGGVD